MNLTAMKTQKIGLRVLACAAMLFASAGLASAQDRGGDQRSGDRPERPSAREIATQQHPDARNLTLRGQHIAILVGEGLHDGETLMPMAYLINRGARVTVIGVKAGEVKAYNSDITVNVNATVENTRPQMFNALVLPGGEGPSNIRDNENVIRFVRAFYELDRPIAAICHGPQVLASAGVLEGKTATCIARISSELREAGAEYKDEAVVIDGNLITSRVPEDIPLFCRAIERMLVEHQRDRGRPGARDREGRGDQPGRGRGRDRGRDRDDERDDDGRGRGRGRGR